jgi:hypothetical protein
MVVWLVVTPTVLLLLALAGANWKTFHLAYCKHLMRSSNPDDRWRGLKMVVEIHLSKGMSPEQLRPLVAPLHLDMCLSPEEELQQAKETAQRLRSCGMLEDAIKRLTNRDEIMWKLKHSVRSSHLGNVG